MKFSKVRKDGLAIVMTVHKSTMRMARYVSLYRRSLFHIPVPSYRPASTSRWTSSACTPSVGSSLRILPERMMRIRLQLLTTSGISSEMRSTAIPVCRELPDGRVNGALCHHVDAYRGPVEDEDPRLRSEPLGDHHALLVAAGECLYRDTGVRELDMEGFDPLRGLFSALLRIHEPYRGQELLEDGRGYDVVCDRLLQNEPLDQAVLRDVGNAALICVLNRGDLHGLSVDEDFSALGRTDAKERQGKLGPPRTDEPCDADDLSGTDGRRYPRNCSAQGTDFEQRQLLAQPNRKSAFP